MNRESSGVILLPMIDNVELMMSVRKDVKESKSCCYFVTLLPDSKICLSSRVKLDYLTGQNAAEPQTGPTWPRGATGPTGSWVTEPNLVAHPHRIPGSIVLGCMLEFLDVLLVSSSFYVLRFFCVYFILCSYTGSANLNGHKLKPGHILGLDEPMRLVLGLWVKSYTVSVWLFLAAGAKKNFFAQEPPNRLIWPCSSEARKIYYWTFTEQIYYWTFVRDLGLF